MKIGIFTGATSARSNNIFTDISRYPTRKHEIKSIIARTLTPESIYINSDSSYYKINMMCFN